MIRFLWKQLVQLLTNTQPNMNTIILGDFNMSFENSHLQNLMQIYDLCPLIKKPTCFQSHNSTCIGNFLTYQKAMFKLSRLFETGLSDHHRLISVMK